jgi:putative nucleotidyltransferase with HDIG domain
LADALGASIERSELHTALTRTHDHLAEAYNHTLEGWALALELRDRETAGHTRRVAEMTVRLARLMGMDGENLTHIRRGALLHDIGKMGVPDSILLKPGPLMDTELDVMRLHPVYAYELLQGIPYLHPALDIPYAHHERWDGTGYPRGLAGEDIPIAARMFAIVDAWDAMRTDRPYRAALPREAALAEIEACAGTHFDPAVVEAFLLMMRGQGASPSREEGGERLTAGT